MKKNNKKGFTIVELVIVIAVIAILAAVLIPTFSSIIKKAKVNNDIQLVRNLNTALATENKKHATMQDALDAAAEFGYDVAKINASATDNEILWDSVNDVFCYLNTEKNALEYIPSSVADDDKLSVGSYLLWKISNKVDEIYSTYYTGSETIINTSKGFDAGTTKGITAIKYENTTGTAQEVVIRTNGGSLTINDTNNKSHQIHYGSAANVTIATGTSCYEGHAVVAAMTITQGHAIADSGAYVGVVKASEGVTLSEVNNGVFVIPQNVATSEIPAAVASQIKYTVDGGKFVASSEKVNKSYYVVRDYDDLVSFRVQWNSGLIPGSANVKFADNITIQLGDDEAWTPIGNWQYPFNGVFDGNGCTISGIKADATHTNYDHTYAVGVSVGFGETYGFFGIVGNGDTTIKNMTLKDISIVLDNGKNVGGLIGYAPNSDRFFSDGNKYIKIKRDGSPTANGEPSDWWAKNNTAGEFNLTLDSITVSGIVKGHSHIAGIAGKLYNAGDITIIDCHNKAAVTGQAGFIGGIVGIQSGDCKLFTVTDCTNENTITLTTDKNGIAGLIGRVNNEVTKNSLVFIMNNCSNSGTIDNQQNCTSNGNLYYYNNVYSVTVDGVKIK